MRRRKRIVAMMIMMMVAKLTFGECKGIVAILKTSDGVERTIQRCQVVSCRFLQITAIIIKIINITTITITTIINIIIITTTISSITSMTMVPPCAIV